MTGLLSGYLQSRRTAIVQGYVKGDVLDIGCGVASVAELFEPSQRYVGMEVRPAFISYARRRFPQHTFVRRDVDRERLSLGALQFDTVLMLAVIEHLARPEKVIAEVRNHMNPGAYLIICTPTTLGSALHRLGAKVRLFSEEAVAEHKCIYDRHRLTDFLAQLGMQVVLYRKFEFGANQLCISTTSP